MAYSNVQTGTDPNGNPIYSSGSGAAPASSATGGGTSGGSGTTATQGDINSDPFIASLRTALSSASGAISSADSNIESTVNDAVAGLKTAQTNRDTAITGQYQQSLDYQGQQNANSENAFTANGRGYGTNVAAFKQLQDYNKKSIADLTQQRDNALMTNDSQYASQVSTLMMNKLQFEQTAAQQTFTNLLGLGNFALSARSQQQSEQTQAFNEKTAISQVALKYGLTVQPGDTIDSITSKAMPMASAEEKLQLASLQSQINANNAATSKALNDIKTSQPLDATSLDSLARAYQSNPGSVLGVVKTTQQLGQILTQVGAQHVSDGKSAIDQNVTNGVTQAQNIKDITGNTNLSPSEQAQLLAYVDQKYSALPKKTTTSSGGAFGSFEDFMNSLGSSLLPPSSR